MDKNKFDEFSANIRELQKKFREMNDKINSSNVNDKDIQDLQSTLENLKNNTDLFVKFTNDTLYNIKDKMKNNVTLSE